jgi:hypothetical protein
MSGGGRPHGDKVASGPRFRFFFWSRRSPVRRVGYPIPSITVILIPLVVDMSQTYYTNLKNKNVYHGEYYLFSDLSFFFSFLVILSFIFL